MKFIHQNFELIVIPKNSNGRNKSLEFIFGDENIYKKEINRIGGNFRKENKSNFEIIHDGNIELDNGYYKEVGDNNIFYDYNELEFKLSKGYKLAIDSDYNNSGFLEELKKDEDELNKYKLSYKSNDENGKIYGFWGFVKFIIYNDTEKYIFSPFFKTKNLKEDEDVSYMLDSIKEELFYSLFTNKNISLSSYKIKIKKDETQALWSFINIFDLVYKDLEKSINDITEQPKYINTISSEFKRYHGGKINIDNRFINDSIKRGYYDIKNNKLDIYGKRISQRKIVGEYNNVSNKIFIDLNLTLIKKLDNFLKVSENKIKLDYLDTIKEKRNKISSKRISFINKYDLNLIKLGNFSVDYQHLDSKYKKFVINYLKLFFMLDLLSGEIMLANKSIDQIYEYWTLIRTRDILLELLEGDKNKKAIFNIKKNNDDLVFELGDNSKVEIKGKNGECSIIYKFQNSISSISNETKGAKNDIRILSANVKPDVFINIKKEDTESFYVMDAKYSTNENLDIHKDRFENLYKYKSGIVKCDNLYYDDENSEWKGNIKNIIDEVVAIYPGENTNKLAKLYNKSIREVGFGGLVMKPGNDEDIYEYFKNKI